MKFVAGDISYQDGVLSVSIPKEKLAQLEKLINASENGKPLDIDINVHYKGRTLRQNNMFWGMLAEEAEILKTTSWELYLKALEDYGVSRLTAIDPEDFEKEEKCHRIVRARKYTYIEGYKFLVVQIWDGSSGYNRAEMSRFIDGIIDDCKELGIDYLSPEDKALLLDDFYRG